MYVKAFIVNVNKSLKPFFSRIVNIVALQSFWFICSQSNIVLGKFEFKKNWNVC